MENCVAVEEKEYAEGLHEIVCVGGDALME